MKIKVGKKLYDTNIEPVLILFEAEEEKIFHIKSLLDMNGKEGQLGYAVFPLDYPQDKLQRFLALKGISDKPINNQEG